jgi:hypothetical protein
MSAAAIGNFPISSRTHRYQNITAKKEGEPLPARPSFNPWRKRVFPEESAR